MGLLGGSLLYTAPVPELSRYEPTGTFMSTAKFEISFTNDGRNWQRANYEEEEDPPGIGFGVYAEVYKTQRPWVVNDRWPVVLPAFFVNTYAFRMVNSGDTIRFQRSNDPPEDPEPDEVEDDFDGSIMLAKGAKWVGKGTVVLKTSGDSIDWDDIADIEDPLGSTPNWPKIAQGVMKFMPEVGVQGLFLALGATPAIIQDGYWTSGPSGTGWSDHTFPEDFSGQGANDWVDWLVGNGDEDDPVLVIGLENNGRIYTSPNGTDWTLRFDPFPAQIVNSIAWNPMANNGNGAFFAVMGNSLNNLDNPNNLLTSPDGIFWNPVDPNDLPSSVDFSLACDTGKNLMIARASSSQFEPGFQNGGYFMSDDDGESWKEFADRRGGFVQFIDRKIGPVIDETVFIDTGPIVISDTRSSPDTAQAALLIEAFNQDQSNLVQEFTSRDSSLGLGFWALEQFPLRADTLNPFYYQIRLDRISGDDFFEFSASIDEWIDFPTTARWRYLLNAGPDVKTFTGTLRIREKETLIESNSVSVQIDCEVLLGADLTSVVATPAVGTVGFIPHGEAALGGVESVTAVGGIGTIGVDVNVELTGVEATPAVGTVTPT